MESLARFIMAGRLKAALVAFFGNLLPLISPAAVGLVALRHNITDAVLVSLWAILPLVLVLAVTDMNAMMIWVSMVSVGVVLFGAQVLRLSLSWSWSLLCMLACSAILAFMMGLILDAELEAMRAALLDMLNQMAKQQGQVIDMVPSDLFLTGLIAWVIALTAIGSLLLARWWQALLYNPGGFRLEFHGLRIEKTAALLLMAGLIACYLLSRDYFTWGNLLGLPLLLSGIALVHHAVAFAQLSGYWLVFFYIGLVILVGPLSTVMVGLGFLDSMLDLRARLTARKAGS